MKNVCVLLAAMGLLAVAGMAQRSITLEESKHCALESNAKVKNSALELEAARQTRNAALTNYFPTISAGGAKFESQDPMMDVNTKGGNLPVYDGTLVGLATARQWAYLPPSTTELLKRGTFGYLNVVQPIFMGGRIINGNRLASVQEDVREDQNIVAVNDVLVETETQYWRVVSLEATYRTVLRYEEMLAHLSSQVEDAYKAGLVLKNDLLKIRLKQSEVLLTKSRVANGKKLAAMAFCQYVGIPYDSALVLVDSLAIGGLPESIRVDHGAAVKQRAEYRMLANRVDAERLQSRIKLGEYLPSVGVGVSGIYEQIDHADRKRFGMVYGTVSVPISKWWEASHTLQEHGARVEIAENDFRDKSELLLLEIEKSWEDLTEAFQQVKVSQEAVVQAAENLRLNQDSYAGGLSPVSDVLDAQAQVQKTNQELIDAMAQYRILWARYRSNTGRYQGQ